MIIAGSTSGVGNNIAIPAHQAGDMILVFVRRANSATPPTIPAATATVPTWNTIQTGGANTLSMISAYATATTSNHVTGTWTNAAHIVVFILRPDAGKMLSIAGSSTGNANGTQTIVYPALTVANTDGSSMGFRVGTRAIAAAAVGNAPANWTNQIMQPAAAGALMAVHTRDALTANEALASVATTGTNSAYRAHTIEVNEGGPPTPTYETIIDDFNRANGLLNAGAGSAWLIGWMDSNDPCDLRVISNRLGSQVADWQQAYLTAPQIDGANCDVLIDCAAVPVVPNNEFGIYYLVTNPGAPFACYAVFWSQGSWLLRRYANGLQAGGNLQVVTGTIAVGDTIWFSKRGSALKVYKRPSAGSFAQIMAATDANHNPVSGVIGVELSDTTQRWDNLRGGPIASAVAAPKIVSII